MASHSGEEENSADFPPTTISIMSRSRSKISTTSSSISITISSTAVIIVTIMFSISIVIIVTIMISKTMVSSIDRITTTINYHYYRVYQLRNLLRA